MKIVEVTEWYIKFDDNSIITYTHEQSCCEQNYADFEQIDDLALTYDYGNALDFDRAEGGFTFHGNKENGRQCTPDVYIPCYSQQNGYYTQDITIVYEGKNALSFEAEICDYLLD